MTAKAEAETAVPHVLTAINAVMLDVSKEGIAKDRNNQQQGYKFRGIDDVYNALAPLLAQHKLIITPRGKNRTSEERQTRNGGTLFNVTVEVEYELASALDASTKLAGPFWGEAMDSADKATNKAMSAAYKYMAMQEFCIPTEGDNDADATSHDVAPRNQQRQPPQQQQTQRQGFGQKPASTGASDKKPDAAPERNAQAVIWCKNKVDACKTFAEFQQWMEATSARILGLHAEDRAEVRKYCEVVGARLKNAETKAPTERDPFGDDEGPKNERSVVGAMKAAISICDDQAALDAWAGDNEGNLKGLSDAEYDDVLAYWRARSEKVAAEKKAA